ncbi:MAG: F0F1 ATP synthase subunit delta [Candidatus Omnitrophica bacterium]|nr:F0F1 ATP synthase subunit delta [Candidatus Omnitrophota bacterium]
MLALVVTLIVLLVIIFVVMIAVFRRVMAGNISSATSHIAHLHEEYTKKEEAADKRLAEAQSRAEEIVQKAEEQAQVSKEDILKRAGEEKETLIKEARNQAEEIVRQADKSRQQLLGEVEQRIQKQAKVLVGSLVEDALPQDLKREVHERWINELLTEGFRNVDRLKVPEDAAGVKVVSAFELKEEDKKRLISRLEDALGRRFSIVAETDPGLIAGVVVSIGSLVLDGSLRYKIQEKTR